MGSCTVIETTDQGACPVIYFLFANSFPAINELNSVIVGINDSNSVIVGNSSIDNLITSSNPPERVVWISFLEISKLIVLAFRIFYTHLLALFLVYSLIVTQNFLSIFLCHATFKLSILYSKSVELYIYTLSNINFLTFFLSYYLNFLLLI